MPFADLLGRFALALELAVAVEIDEAADLSRIEPNAFAGMALIHHHLVEGHFFENGMLAARAKPLGGGVVDLDFEVVLREAELVVELGRTEETAEFVVVEPQAVTEEATVDL